MMYQDIRKVDIEFGLDAIYGTLNLTSSNGECEHMKVYLGHIEETIIRIPGGPDIKKRTFTIVEV